MSAEDPNEGRTAANALLRSAAGGDARAAADLLPLVYDELRRLAGARLASLPPGQTLQPTALVHDVYMKLVGDEDPGWDGQAHFFGAAARAMRNLLVDGIRRKSRVKHGGGRARADIDVDLVPPIALEVHSDEVLALDEALDRLQSEYPRVAEIVLLRQFAGLMNPSIAEILGVSRGTVDRDWRFALAWLHRELVGDAGEPGDAAR